MQRIPKRTQEAAVFFLIGVILALSAIVFYLDTQNTKLRSLAIAQERNQKTFFLKETNGQ